MAWLHATPKPPEGTKRAENTKSAIKLSRHDQMKKAGITPKMPPNPMPHMIERLVEIGLTESNGMGAVPIGWATIDAWQRCTGIELDPWEAKLLRRLSAAYVVESRRAEDETCSPPFHTGPDRREVETEHARLIALLG
jgi:hypothetical protein